MNDSRLEGLQDFLDKSRDADTQRLFELLWDVEKKLGVVETKLGELEGRVESLSNWRSRLRLKTEKL